MLDNLLLKGLRGENLLSGDFKAPTDREWEALVDLSIKHHVAPILYHLLVTRRVKVPGEALSDLKKNYHRQAIITSHIYREFSKVLADFRHNGIDVIVLKGVHLAELVYKNMALRPMGDVDILVRNEDLTTAETRLLALGYDPPEHPRLKKKHKTRLSRINFENAEGMSVEVHWVLDRPDSPFRIDTQGLWSRSRPAVIAGVETRVLCPEDLLLHMCWQASANKMFARGLLALCDVRQIINTFKQGLDWEVLQRRVEQWGFERIVYITLYFAADLLRAKIPEDFLKALQPAALDRELLAYARTRILDSSDLSDDVLQLGRKGSFGQKLSFLFSRLFPSRDTLVLKYGESADSWRMLAFYLRHLKQLFQRYGHVLWRFLVRDKEMMDRAETLGLKDDLKNWLCEVSDSDKNG